MSKQEVLLRLIERKFGHLETAAKRKISACRDLERLDQAIDRFLDAESVEEVLQPIRGGEGVPGS